ncbi:uncharacterized protein LOC124186831 [Neodiprion fabricii]|uniref:uncharacterized protein LOC124186831 n=1 Tax=Neodiprion fabricii TaxID=2872261 RepID=UPI001ED927A3|nr:uncharacterized protein LOC124186831 [Neodiprion fabricii]
MLRIRACMFLCSLLGPKDVSPCACIADDPRDKSGLKRISEQFNRKCLKMASAKQKVQSISAQDDAAAEMDEHSKEAKEAPEAGSSKVDGAGKSPEQNLQQLDTNITTSIEKVTSAKQKEESISEQDYVTVEMDEYWNEAMKEALEASSSKVDGAGKSLEQNLQQLDTNITTPIEKITSAKQKEQSISEQDDVTVEMDDYWNEEMKEALEASSSKVDGFGRPATEEICQRMDSRMITLTEQLKLIEGQIGKLNVQDPKCRNRKPIAIPEPPSPDTLTGKPLLAELMKSIGQLTVERDILQVKLRIMASEIKVHNPKSRVRKKAQVAISDVTSAFDLAKNELRLLEEEAANLIEPFDKLTDDVEEFRFIRKLREQLESDELVLFRHTGKE